MIDKNGFRPYDNTHYKYDFILKLAEKKKHDGYQVKIYSVIYENGVKYAKLKVKKGH